MFDSATASRGLLTCLLVAHRADHELGVSAWLMNPRRVLLAAESTKSPTICPDRLRSNAVGSIPPGTSIVVKVPSIIEKGVQTGYHLRCTGLVISDDLPAAIDSQSAIIKYFRKGDIYRRHNSVVIQKTVITDSVVERSDDLTFVADSERHGAQGIRYNLSS